MAETRNQRIMAQLARESRENVQRYWAGKQEAVCIIPNCGLRAPPHMAFCAHHRDHSMRRPKPWMRCPSTHCERRAECASPSDCTVKS
jgi:hypothetical protein